ncbi:hypothetical protein ACIBCR_16535 [Micromonospora echinospora]|uniref:hypothetical protein n=1 Tax=Micromonospora echinospora TaxID=1877 RepID=UPI0037AB1DB6
MTDRRLLVALVVTVVVLLVAIAMWWLAERSLRRTAQIAEGRRIRIGRLIEDVASLTADNTALRAELTRYQTAHAALAPDTTPDPLEALYALPAYDPEGNR